MIAFETAQGMVMANSATERLERAPTPPPKITKRMKEAMGPGAAEVAVSGFCASGDFMAGAPSEAAGGDVAVGGGRVDVELGGCALGVQK